MPPKDKPEPDADAKKTCFVIMPISAHHPEAYGGDGSHFRTVYEHLFVPAIRSLENMEPCSPIVQGTKFIQGEIVRQLLSADMVLCDMSSYNPNVFLELGIRIAASRPICLVVDDVTVKERLPFDTSHLNHLVYKSNPGYDVESQRGAVAAHIRSTMDDPELGIRLWKEWSLQSSLVKPATMEAVGTNEEMTYLLHQLWMMVQSGKGWEGGRPAGGAANDELADPHWLLNLLLDLDDSAVRVLQRVFSHAADAPRHAGLGMPVAVSVPYGSLVKITNVLRAANITGVQIKDGQEPGRFMLEFVATPSNIDACRMLAELIGPSVQKGGWHNLPPPPTPDRGRRMPPPRSRSIPPPPKQNTLLP